MTPFVKALLALALVVPLVAYVAGTLSSSGPGAPEQQGTVYLDDAEPAGDTTTGSTTDDQQEDRQDDRQGPRKPARGSDTSGDSRDDDPDDDQQQPGPSETDDREARVVTPAPVGRDDDDDDDERDDDRDDTDDGGDTDD